MCNEKLNLDLIDSGLRGCDHLANLLLRKDINVTAIFDKDPARISIAKVMILKLYGKVSKTFICVR